MSRRNLIAFLTGAAVVVLVAGGVVLLGPFEGDSPGSSSTATSPGAATTTAAALPPSTTEPDPSASTTTSPVTVWDDGRYQVVGVASDDVLNVRDNPGVSNPIVGSLPPGGRVELYGYSAISSGAEWRSVLLEDGTSGWVNASFLAPPDGWEVPFEGLPCRADGAAYGGTQTVGGSAAGEGAGNALDVFTYRSDECERIVIVLGQGAGLTGAGWSSIPAATVPPGTTAISGNAIVEVRIPGVLEVRPVAQTVDWESGFVLATRDMPLAGSREDLVFRAFFGSNRRAAVSHLDNPARVVVDIRSAPTGAGLDVAAKRDGLTVVIPIQVDVNGPGVSLPIEVTGWGRPFEAQGAAVLRRAASEPGTGELVEATFSGTDSVGVQAASTYPYGTADYIEAWGALSFAIDDIAPGTYELFVGEFSAESGEPLGVYQAFNVAG